MRAAKRRAGRAIRKRRRAVRHIQNFALAAGVQLGEWQVVYLTELMLLGGPMPGSVRSGEGRVAFAPEQP